MSAPLIPARQIPAKWRKLIGAVAVMAVLFAWIWAFAGLYDRLPQNRFVHLIYFVALGVGWVLPIIPLITWMGKADKPLNVGER